MAFWLMMALCIYWCPVNIAGNPKDYHLYKTVDFKDMSGNLHKKRPLLRISKQTHTHTNVAGA